MMRNVALWAMIVVGAVLAVMVAAWLLSGCGCQPMPRPTPEPIVDSGPNVDDGGPVLDDAGPVVNDSGPNVNDAGPDDGGSDAGSDECAVMCARYRALDCTEGDPTADRGVCEDWCRAGEDAGIDLAGPPVCVIVARTCDDVGVCASRH